MLKKSLVALALLCTLLLCCCNSAPSGDGNANDVTTPTSGSAANDVTTPADTCPQLDANTLGIVWEGNTEYTVIRAEYAGSAVQKAASSVYSTINTKTGANLKISTDWSRDPSAIDHNAPEIIIGDTNRNACHEVVSKLSPMTFTIRVVNDQLIIAGTTDRLTSLATEYFINEYLSNPEYCSEGKLTLPRNLNVVKGPFEPEMTDIINTKDSYTTKQKPILSIPGTDGFRIMQGGCTDGKYCYFAMNDGNVTAVICKYEITTRKLIKRSAPLPLDHSNDICYNPDTGKLVVAHNAPNRNTVSIVDPETLEVEQVLKIKCEIFAISYNQARKQYVVGLSGGQNFATLDEDFKLIEIYHVNSTGYTTQGVESDDNFIYFVQYKENVIIIYDWNGKRITRVDLDLKGVEPENISLIGNKFIIACNNSSWTGGAVYEVELVNKSN